eukprot:g4741.t1
MSLKARWIPNGKKPAPFSKRYRDKHGIKSGEGTYVSNAGVPSSSSHVAQSSGNAASMREARLRALQNRQKNMDAALAAASHSNSGGGGGGRTVSNGSLTKPGEVRRRKGGVHELHTIRKGTDDQTSDSKGKGNNYYTGGSQSGQAVLGRPDDQDHNQDSDLFVQLDNPERMAKATQEFKFKLNKDLADTQAILKELNEQIAMFKAMA